jgi:putative SOS response-associated peptidase YedK
MSSRYTLFKINNLRERFHLEKMQEINRSYNISPTQTAPVIVNRDGKPSLEIMKWGFIPKGAKDTNSVFRYKTFNAKSEGIFSKASYSEPIRHSRCLIPANGFYEWQQSTDGKKPYYVHPNDQELFAFAGIYSSWTDPAGKEWGTYSIITIEANDEMSTIHDRMPIILQPQDEEKWLSDSDELNMLYDVMRPYPNGKLVISAVGDDINGTKIDNPRLITPIQS